MLVSPELVKTFGIIGSTHRHKANTTPTAGKELLIPGKSHINRVCLAQAKLTGALESGGGAVDRAAAEVEIFVCRRADVPLDQERMPAVLGVKQ